MQPRKHGSPPMDVICSTLDVQCYLPRRSGETSLTSSTRRLLTRLPPPPGMYSKFSAFSLAESFFLADLPATDRYGKQANSALAKRSGPSLLSPLARFTQARRQGSKLPIEARHLHKLAVSIAAKLFWVHTLSSSLFLSHPTTTQQFCTFRGPSKLSTSNPSVHRKGTRKSLFTHFWLHQVF